MRKPFRSDIFYPVLVTRVSSSIKHSLIICAL